MEKNLLRQWKWMGLVWLWSWCVQPLLAQQKEERAAQFAASDWMRCLPDDAYIARLSLPGTHDSGSRYGGAGLKTQTSTIEAQLAQGIRVFDIRLKAKGEALGIYRLYPL